MFLKVIFQRLLFFQEKERYIFLFDERREEKERTRHELLYLFIYLLYVWKQEQNGNTTANAKYFEKNKKEQVVVRNLF